MLAALEAVVGEVAVPTTPTPVAGAEGRRTEDAGAHTEGPGAGDDELVVGAEQPGVQAPPAPSVSTKTCIVCSPFLPSLLPHGSSPPERWPRLLPV